MISQIALNEQFGSDALSPTKADNISFLGIGHRGRAPHGSVLYRLLGSLATRFVLTLRRG